MKTRQLISALLVAATMMIVCDTATACNVPVFRYALERWQPDAYELIIFHEGPLTDEQQALIKRLEEKIIQDEFYVRAFDMAEIPKTFPSAQAAPEEAAAEKSASAEAAADDSTPDDSTTEAPISEDPISEDPISEDPISEDPISEDPTSEDGAAEADAEEDAVSETAAPTDEDPAGEAIKEPAAPQRPDPRQAVRELFDSLDADQLPWLLVRYPKSYPDDPPAYSGPLSSETIDALLDSPTRREIARRILDGDSVVWLLIQSGDTKLDEAAEKTLTAQLKELADELELPELEAEDEQYMEADAAPELRLAFSLLTVSRSDPGERMFLQLLDAWDPEALDEDKPAAFAFFGRGRALGPLVGEELVPEVVSDACFYLTGPCSCQIKQQNPGFDMLMSVDWEGVIYGEYTLAEALPRLTTAAAAIEDNVAIQKAIGADTLAAVTAGPQTLDADSGSSSGDGAVKDATTNRSTTATAATKDETPAAESPTTASASGNSFMAYVSAAVAAGVVIVVLGSLVILGRQRGNGSEPS